MKKWLLFIFISLLVYGLSLRYGFSQDDFYFLILSRIDSPLSFLQFFSPWHQQGFPFFRPLGTQFFFALSTGLAGLSQAPLFMHSLMLLIHGTSGYLVYQLLLKLKYRPLTSLLVAILYTASATHFLSLFYIAATQQLLAAMFSLLFLNALFAKSRRAPLWLLLALLSKENAVVAPLIAGLIYQLRLLLPLRKIINKLIPSIVTIVFYLGLRYLSGIVVQSTYHPDLSLKLISSLRWYFLFAYNAPEELIRYAGSKMFVNFYRYIWDFGYVGIINAVSLITLSLLSLTLMVRRLVLSPSSRRLVTLYILWWLTGIALIIWFPDHRYPHYLDLALIPLLLTIIDLKRPKLQLLVVAIYLLGAFSGIAISVARHWTIGRAEMSKSAINYFDSHQLCQQQAIEFVAKEDIFVRELSYTLSLENGPRAICQNNIKVYYQGIVSDPTGEATKVSVEEILNL